MTRAFTLIETLLYLGLPSLLMSGAFVTAYTSSELSNRSETIAYVQSEEAWAQSVIQKSIESTSAISIEDNGATMVILNAISMRMYGAHGQLIKEGSEAEIFTSENLSLTNLHFTSVVSSETTMITTVFTVKTKTIDGHTVLRTFQFNTYISL